MLIRPKSASRTRTIHVDSKIAQNNNEGLTCKGINIKRDSILTFNEANIEELNTSPIFETKNEVSIENTRSPYLSATKANSIESVQKRSISSQDHKGRVNEIYEDQQTFVIFI